MAQRDLSDLFFRLSRSAFRSRFYLKPKDREYVWTKGMDTVRRHAYDFVRQRLAPAVIPNDGKQTPMRGHPVFLAQHGHGDLLPRLPVEMASHSCWHRAHAGAAGLCGGCHHDVDRAGDERIAAKGYSSSQMEYLQPQ